MPGGHLSMARFAQLATRAVLWELDFTSLAATTDAASIAAAKAYLTARGVTFARSSVATMQTSASSLYTGIGVNDPRIGDAGYGRGLEFEEARTNDIANCTPGSAGHSVSNVTVDVTDGPDGTTTYGRRVTDASASTGFVSVPTPTYTAGAAMVASRWHRQPVSDTGAATDVVGYNLNDAVLQDPTTRPLGSTWSRKVKAYTGGGGGTSSHVMVPNYTAAANVGVIDWAFVQRESGKFATSAIITTGASATRAGDRVYIPNVATGPDFSRAGRLGLEVRFVAKGSPSEMSDANRRIFSYNSSNDCRLDTTGKVSVRANGAAYVTTVAPSWSRGDIVTLWIEAGGGTLVTRVLYRIGYAASGTLLGESTSPQDGLPSTGALDFLSSAGAAQFSSWAQHIRAYAPGRRPAWAA